MSKALQKAQQKVEARNYEIRKNLLKYDDVMNDQRKVFYEQRREILNAESVQETVVSMRDEVIEELVHRYIPARSYAEQWEVQALEAAALQLINLHLPIAEWAAEEGIAEPEILSRINAAIAAKMAEKEERYTPRILRMAEKHILLHSIDGLWKEHLHTLDHLRQGIHLRGYGQRDPLNEYKQEAFSLFESMLSQLREQVTMRLAWLEVTVDSFDDQPATLDRSRLQEGRTDPAEVSATVTPIRPPFDPNNPESWGRVKRNDDCPCGSGKKYKHCHGAIV
jgi:preprotein translocase subunit SecA